MTRRIVPLLAVLSLAAAACGPPDFQASSPPASELGFVPQVVDIMGDTGFGLSLTVDADGNPHLSYLALEPTLEPGEPQPPPDPEAPLFPAVRHAHLTGGAWTKTTVAEELKVAESDVTAIAVDGEGVHHVVWTENAQVFYASNAGGDFSDPEPVAKADVAGLDIAAADDGTPWVSFYEVLGGAEGPAALVRVASPGGDGWEVQTAAEADSAEPMTTGIGIGRDGPVVGYGSAGRTLVATQDGEIWSSQDVDEGGLGVSLDAEQDSVHVAYYTAQGSVRHAEAAGGSFETAEVTEAGGAPEKDWVTSIDIGPDGHWLAWQGSDGIHASSGMHGGGEEDHDMEPLRATDEGLRPQVGVGAEGAVFVGWQDTENRTLNVSVQSEEEPLLAAPPEGGEEPQPGPTDGGDGGGGGPPECEPEGTEIVIVAPVGAVADGFDTDCIAAPAGEEFTIDFDNQDTGVPHNVATYADESAAQEFFVGEIITAPDQIVYEPDPVDEPGNYYFQCDVHPNMNGTFSVA